MSELQLSMLQKDVYELQSYISEVEKRGKTSLAEKLQSKLTFLQSKISEHN